ATQVPRVAAGTVVRVLVGGAVGELVQRDLAENDGPRGPKSPGHLRVSVRDSLSEERRADRRPEAGGVDVVLQRERKPVEGAERRAGREGLVRGARLLQRRLGVDGDEGADVAVEAFD